MSQKFSRAKIILVLASMLITKINCGKCFLGIMVLNGGNIPITIDWELNENIEGADNFRCNFTLETGFLKSMFLNDESLNSDFEIIYDLYLGASVTQKSQSKTLSSSEMNQLLYEGKTFSKSFFTLKVDPNISKEIYKKYFASATQDNYKKVVIGRVII